MKHIKRWLSWSKIDPSTNWHKFLVLIGIRQDLSLFLASTKEEKQKIREVIRRYV